MISDFIAAGSRSMLTRMISDEQLREPVLPRRSVTQYLEPSKDDYWTYDS